MHNLSLIKKKLKRYGRLVCKDVQGWAYKLFWRGNLVTSCPREFVIMMNNLFYKAA
jgi:hypothetical protein